MVYISHFSSYPISVILGSFPTEYLSSPCEIYQRTKQDSPSISVGPGPGPLQWTLPTYLTYYIHRKAWRFTRHKPVSTHLARLSTSFIPRLAVARPQILRLVIRCNGLRGEMSLVRAIRYCQGPGAYFQAPLPSTQLRLQLHVSLSPNCQAPDGTAGLKSHAPPLNEDLGRFA
jgi:hypothetical protein